MQRHVSRKKNNEMKLEKQFHCFDEINKSLGMESQHLNTPEEILVKHND